MPNKYPIIIILFLVLFFMAILLFSDALKPSITRQQLTQSASSDLNYLKARTDDCLKNEERATPCLEDFFKNYLQQFSAKETLERLGRIAKESRDAGEECHVVAHAVGRQILADRKTIDRAFQECTEACSKGCFHGVVEKFFWQEGPTQLGEIHNLNREEFAKKIKDACTNAPTEEIQGECWHGVGHGLVLTFEYDIPKALSFCDFYGLEEERKGCYSGVFMENVLGVGIKQENKRFLKQGDWHYPCNALDKKYRDDCYRYQVIWMEVNGLSPENVVAECKKTGEGAPACIESLGANLGDFLGNNFNDMAGVCTDLENSLKYRCISGAAAAVIEEGERAISQFCDAFRVKSDKDYCYSKKSEVLESDN